MSISTVFRFQTFNVLHPDLRGLSETELKRRSSFPWRFFRPAAEQVSWYGGAIRPDGSGQGMYMTEPQAQAWSAWVVSDTKVGPS